MPGHDHVEVLVAAGEHRAEDRQQPERQHDAEEGRARVAPEHPALEPVLAPRRAPPGHGRPAFTRRPPSARDRRPRGSGGSRSAPRAARRAPSASAVSSCSSAVGSSVKRSSSVPSLAAPGDPVARGAERVRRALGEDPPVLEDRDAVGQRLRLVQVVRGQHDGLAEVAQRADHVPGGAPGAGIEARRRLVEEDQLRVADQREREVQPPRLAAAERPRAARRRSRRGPRARAPRPPAAAPGTARPSARPSRRRSGADRCRSSAGRCRPARAAAPSAFQGRVRAR